MTVTSSVPIAVTYGNTETGRASGMASRSNVTAYADPDRRQRETNCVFGLRSTSIPVSTRVAPNPESTPPARAMVRRCGLGLSSVSARSAGRGPHFGDRYGDFPPLVPSPAPSWRALLTRLPHVRFHGALDETIVAIAGSSPTCCFWLPPAGKACSLPEGLLSRSGHATARCA